MKTFLTKIGNKIMDATRVVRENPLLMTLIAMSILSDWFLRVLTVGGAFKIKPILVNAALMLLVSALIMLLSGKHRKRIYGVVLFLVTALNISNYLYYTHFYTFLSAGIFKQAKQLTDMKNNLTTTLNFKVLLFLIPMMIYYVIAKKLEKQGHFAQGNDKQSAKIDMISAFTLGTALLIVMSFTLTDTDISRFKKQWNREYLVEEFGVYSYATADLIKTVTVPRTVEADYEDYDEKVQALIAKNTDNQSTNRYTNVLEGKDLYVIHYESVQTFAMDLAFADGEVTPFLNKLSRESLFFNNFYPQHSVGTSSDSEFTFSTSLYPINNRTVFIDHADKEYSTIQKLLGEKGYHVMSMHANNGAFWNRNIMHETLGYHEFVEKLSYEINDEDIVGLGLNDMAFYKQSVQMLKERKEKENKPIMATLISLSNHYPFDELDVYGEFDTGHLEGTEIANYLKSMNYADQALELFFTEMEKEGLLDNAAVVIYGDHHAKISQEDYELVFNYDPETDSYLDKDDENYTAIKYANLRKVRRTPLIIWTKEGGLQETISRPMGMIDVFPTLANMLNIENPYQLGKDIFSVADNMVILPNGSFITSDYFYNSSNLKVYDIHNNELLMKKDEFPEELIALIEKVEEELEFSSKIIESNLIKYNQAASENQASE